MKSNKISITLTEKTFERETDIMILNNSSDITFNIAELSSNSAQILTQMQSCIKQVKEQDQQQQLKIKKLNQFNKIKKKLRQ